MTTQPGTIITCSNFGAKNRVRPSQSGVPLSPTGHELRAVTVRLQASTTQGASF